MPSPPASLVRVPTTQSLQRELTEQTVNSRLEGPWWRIHWFRGVNRDLKGRIPYYWSDWTDAWDYRVIPATVYMYFANVLPALAFSLDMFANTDSSYGVNEVLFASVLGAVVFSLFAAQPLCIVGVTGPITVFNYTVFNIVTPRGISYFPFMCWIGLWSMVMHIGLAVGNSCNAVRWVTRFSCEIFGFYVAAIYIQKGIQVLILQFSESTPAASYLSIAISLLVLIVGYTCSIIGNSRLFTHHIRVFLRDYGTPLTIVFFTGFQYFGQMRDVELQKLPVSKAFMPTIERDWFVRFWEVPVGDVFLAIPFALLLTILFYFDHNVSSLICQGSEFPLRKPAGFHFDILLLGLTTGISGLFGIPAPNGLIPQAPFHTASLCVTHQIPTTAPDGTQKHCTKITRVVEQRASNLAQGLLILVTMTAPLLSVLHLIPQSVLAGLFFVMGLQALEGNGLTLKLRFLFSDPSLLPSSEPLATIAKRKVWIFTGIMTLGFAATFAITQTIAAVGFPVFIFLLVPIRTEVMHRWFSEEELEVLDEPTAGEFTLESVGGSWGGRVEKGVEGDVEEGTGTGMEGGVVRMRAMGESKEEVGGG